MDKKHQSEQPLAALSKQSYRLAEAVLKNETQATNEASIHIIRSITHNLGVSAKLKKRFPQVFSDAERTQRICDHVLDAYGLLEAKQDED